MGRPLDDLSGLLVGRLRVLHRAIRPQSETTYWQCRCECGREPVVAASRLKHRQTLSCGCLARDLSSVRVTTHGRSKTPEYFAWAQACARCNDRNHQAYKDYGGRGIYVSVEWARDFMAFLRDMGPRPSPKHTLDRIDNNGPYTGPCAAYPQGNCRWITHREQCNNRRRNVRLEFEGQSLTISEWARVKNLSITLLYQRVRKQGWSIERALTTPLYR